MFTGKKKTAAFIVVVGILLKTTGLLARQCSDAPPGVSTETRCCITFTGEASGGTLIFCEYQGGKARCATIETVQGESAEKAIERLAKTIDDTNPLDWGGFPCGKGYVYSSMGELKGLGGSCGTHITAGTEIGLGIPLPPYSLTCNYKPEANNITLRWINPSPDAYDYVQINLHKGSGGTVPGNTESYVFDLNKYEADMKIGADFYSKGLGPNVNIISDDKPGDHIIWIVGVRNDIPSNAAAMHVNKNIQQELYSIPFTGGIAPNWESWSLDANENKISFEEGIRQGLPPVPNFPYHPVKTPEKKPFYQVINIGTKGGTGGVFRKFIGLTPGHTYRIKTRVATLTEPNDSQWSFSVHAAPNGSDGRDLTAGQMAGLDALPGGSKGPAMGRMALYDSSLTTKGRFVEISTDAAKPVRGREITDITLPQGVDSMTVWVTCSSSAALSAGLDWIAIEDLSVQNP